MEDYEEPEEYTPAPGDLCRLYYENGEPRVSHYKCDMYADDVVTNPVTGEIIKSFGDWRKTK